MFGLNSALFVINSAAFNRMLAVIMPIGIGTSKSQFTLAPTWQLPFSMASVVPKWIWMLFGGKPSSGIDWYRGNCLLCKLMLAYVEFKYYPDFALF
jgi:hypothetical protein